MRNKFESLSQFVRGKDSKSSLHVGYVKVMERIADELGDSVNMGSSVQYDVGLGNHPDVPGTHALGYNNPVYTISGGLEGGHGLPINDPRIANYNIFIDPFDLAISAELSMMNLDKEEEEDQYFEIKPEEIEDVEISTMTQEIREITNKLFNKANIAIE